MDQISQEMCVYTICAIYLNPSLVAGARQRQSFQGNEKWFRCGVTMLILWCTPYYGDYKIYHCINYDFVCHIHMYCTIFDISLNQCIINDIVILCVDNNLGGTRYRADSDHTLGVAALHWQAHSHLTLAFLQTFFLSSEERYIVNWLYNSIFSVLLLCNLHIDRHIVT